MLHPVRRLEGTGSRYESDPDGETGVAALQGTVSSGVETGDVHSSANLPQCRNSHLQGRIQSEVRISPQACGRSVIR